MIVTAYATKIYRVESYLTPITSVSIEGGQILRLRGVTGQPTRYSATLLDFFNVLLCFKFYVTLIDYRLILKALSRGLL